jgi:hypothetical protein
MSKHALEHRVWMLVGSGEWLDHYMFASVAECPIDRYWDEGDRVLFDEERPGFDVTFWCRQGDEWFGQGHQVGHEPMSRAESHLQAYLQGIRLGEFRLEPVDAGEFVQICPPRDSPPMPWGAEARLLRSMPGRPHIPVTLTQFAYSEIPPIRAVSIPNQQGTYSEVERCVGPDNKCYVQVGRDRSRGAERLIVDRDLRVVVAHSTGWPDSDLNRLVRRFGGIPDTPLREGDQFFTGGSGNGYKVMLVNVHKLQQSSKLDFRTEVCLEGEDGMSLAVSKINGEAGWSVDYLRDRFGNDVISAPGPGQEERIELVSATLAAWLDGRTTTESVVPPLVSAAERHLAAAADTLAGIPDVLSRPATSAPAVPLTSRHISGLTCGRSVAPQ